MAGKVKDVIKRGRETVETAIEHGRATVETAIGHGRATVDSALYHGRATVETAIEHGRATVETAIYHGRATMQAAILHGREDIRIENVPVPEAEAGELIVRVGAALTCGTDLKVFRRGYHARMIVPPALFGHELAGTVVQAGAGVTDFAPGNRVVALNSAPCGECYFCERGQENLCDDLLFNNGAYAEYIRIPSRIVAKNTLHVPDHVPLEHAALTEPLACAVHGFEDSHPHPGDFVAVIGGGPLGLMMLHVASLAGCQTIAVVKHEGQAEAARQLGAAHVVQSTSIRKAVRETRAITPKDRGVDIAIEAVGVPDAWEEAVEMVRKGGTVNFFGGCALGTKVQLDTNRLHYSEITLKATFHHTPETVRRAFALIAERKIRGNDYITGEAPLSRLQQVLHHMLNRNGDIKTAIIPGH